MSSINTPGSMPEANRLAMLNHPANLLNSSQEPEPTQLNTTPTGDEKELNPSDFMSVYQPGTAISKWAVSRETESGVIQLANKVDVKKDEMPAFKKTFYAGGI